MYDVSGRGLIVVAGGGAMEEVCRLWINIAEVVRCGTQGESVTVK